MGEYRSREIRKAIDTIGGLDNFCDREKQKRDKNQDCCSDEPRPLVLPNQ
jgi:hypothetical protein